MKPFDQKEDRVIICSYKFASRKHVDVKNIKWDLVVFEEDHKLRNIWKKTAQKLPSDLKKP
ncbi:SNF2-related protein [Bombella pluederhausensis]|uniref:SNF2-related protein n=1 Tax=Bombella pluederhausensis TaxID=2967336 RepID=UPI003898EBA5